EVPPSADYKVQTWDGATAKRLREAGPPKGVNLFLHALSPDGSRAVGQMYPARGPGIGDGLVIDTATGKPLATVPVPKDTGIYLAAFSPDNSALATMLRSGGLPHTR